VADHGFSGHREWGLDAVKEQNLVIRGQTNFQFQPSIFIRTHNETLSVAMCVCNPNRSPVGINR
jgi:hypothetical protein